MPATIRDVARLARVSVSTVSQSLSGKGRISEQTRQRVLEAARKLHYRPNSIARSLVTRRTRVIGLVIPDITDPYFHEVTRGVQEAAAEFGYLLMLVDLDRTPERDRITLGTLLEYQAAGLIVAGAARTDRFDPVEAVQEVPVVVIGRRSSRHPAVLIDDVAAAERVTAHLIEEGCRQLAHVSGPLTLTTAQDRYQGFLQALARANLACPPDSVVEGAFTPESGYRAAAMLLERVAAKGLRLPDGICVANDQMAIGVIKALKERGYRIPADIAVCGIGNTPSAIYVDPPLTTVAIPLRAMGRRAAECLIELIEGKRGTRLPGGIVERAAQGAAGPSGATPPRTYMPIELLVRASSRRRD